MFAQPFRSRQLLIVTVIVAACLRTFGPTAAQDTPQAGAEQFAEERQVTALLDEFIATFNRRDLDAHLKTYVFPHVRLASGKVLVFAQADDVPRDFLETGLPRDYDHSEWLSREIVQRSAEKVHVATEFRRLRRDGSKIADYQSLYILEKSAGQWRVRGRSSFAP
jgi:hypothetical protein